MSFNMATKAKRIFNLLDIHPIRHFFPRIKKCIPVTWYCTSLPHFFDLMQVLKIRTKEFYLNYHPVWIFRIHSAVSAVLRGLRSHDVLGQMLYHVIILGTLCLLCSLSSLFSLLILFSFPFFCAVFFCFIVLISFLEFLFHVLSTVWNLRSQKLFLIFLIRVIAVECKVELISDHSDPTFYPNLFSAIVKYGTKRSIGQCHFLKKPQLFTDKNWHSVVERKTPKNLSSSANFHTWHL